MEKVTAAVITLCGLLLAAGCASPARITAPVSAAAVGELRPGLLKGYLQPGELPDSLALLPAPPAAGSAAQAADEAAYHELHELLGTARGALAVADADLSPRATGVFACALGVPISESATPNLNMLLRRTLTDAALATYKAKTHYQRTRPFVAFKAPSCTPADEAFLVNDGSYPSGHTAIGWAWALLLTQLAPDHADAILQRGRAFGQSRAICGAHWASDVVAGRTIGAATVARLQEDPVFRAQAEAARTEVAHERSVHATPAGDCTAEATAVASSSSLAP